MNMLMSGQTKTKVIGFSPIFDYWMAHIRVMREIVCPSCANRDGFESRDPFEGKHTYKCLRCGAGFTPRILRKSMLIPSDVWEYREAAWNYIYETESEGFHHPPVAEDNILRAISVHQDDEILKRQLGKLMRRRQRAGV
jgi:DNA-directed RNA polymerase subunit RPC12/RpoP